MAILIDPVSIEPMRRADMEAVQAIDRRCFPTPWLPTAYMTELSNRSACYLVARFNQQIVGFGGQWVIMDEAHITTIAVDPEQQGKKIGERLLIALMEEAVLQGASHTTLEVREGNRIAQNLYRKYGFREAALRKNYYTDNGENAIVMWAEEINTPRYTELLRDLKHELHSLSRTRFR